MFYSHSMYPGALKTTPYKDMMVRHPDKVSVLYSSLQPIFELEL